jgi:putative Mn2+ efflux pump MntP
LAGSQAPDSVAAMGTKFTYALILSICQAVFSLVLYFTGYQTEKLATGQYLQWLAFIIMIVVLYLGIKAVREEKPGQYLTYGQAVGAGTVISVISGLISGVYAFIHFKFINTSFADYQMEIIRGQWANAGMSEAQMEQAEGFTRMFLGPTIQLITTPIAVTLTGLVISLILAIFLKRNPPAGVDVPPPVPA